MKQSIVLAGALVAIVLVLGQLESADSVFPSRPPRPTRPTRPTRPSSSTPPEKTTPKGSGASTTTKSPSGQTTTKSPGGQTTPKTPGGQTTTTTMRPKPPTRTSKPLTTSTTRKPKTTTKEPGEELDEEIRKQYLKNMKDEEELLTKVGQAVQEWRNWIKTHDHKTLNFFRAKVIYKKFKKELEDQVKQTHLRQMAKINAQSNVYPSFPDPNMRFRSVQTSVSDIAPKM